LRFLELYVVLAFAAAWGILELVAMRLDKHDDRTSTKAKLGGAEEDFKRRKY
jgi:hypothetical protein